MAIIAYGSDFNLAHGLKRLLSVLRAYTVFNDTWPKLFKIFYTHYHPPTLIKNVVL
jgi:hypothetical protein